MATGCYARALEKGVMEHVIKGMNKVADAVVTDLQRQQIQVQDYEVVNALQEALEIEAPKVQAAAEIYAEQEELRAKNTYSTLQDSQRQNKAHLVYEIFVKGQSKGVEDRIMKHAENFLLNLHNGKPRFKELESSAAAAAAGQLMKRYLV